MLIPVAVSAREAVGAEIACSCVVPRRSKIKASKSGISLDPAVLGVPVAAASFFTVLRGVAVFSLRICTAEKIPLAARTVLSVTCVVPRVSTVAALKAAFSVNPASVSGSLIFIYSSPAKRPEKEIILSSMKN